MSDAEVTVSSLTSKGISPWKALIAFLAVVVTVFGLWALVRSPTNDFDVIAGSARAALAGRHLYYDGERPPTSTMAVNLNAPATSLLLVPFALLPPAAALAAWTGVNLLALLVACVWIARTVAPGRASMICASVLATQAAFAQIRLGQMGFLLLLLVTAAWIADREGRDAQAGILLGIAMYAKPFLMIVLPYLLIRRAWRFLGSAIAAAVVTAAVGAFSFGFESYREWLAVLGSVGLRSHLLNASVWSIVARGLAPPIPSFHNLTPFAVRPAWVTPLAALCIAVILAGFAWRRLALLREKDGAWAALLLAGIACSPIGWLYYVPIAAGPIWAMGRRAPRALLVAGYAALCIPYVAFAGLRLSPLATITVASCYAWGVLILLGAVFLCAAPANLGSE